MCVYIWLIHFAGHLKITHQYKAPYFNKLFFKELYVAMNIHLLNSDLYALVAFTHPPITLVFLKMFYLSSLKLVMVISYSQNN